MKKILISGFEPFGQNNRNSSLETLNRLPSVIGDTQVIKVICPTVRFTAFEYLKEHLTDDISAILLLGMAENRDKISIERVAINVDDFRIPDNERNQPVDEIIKADGQPAYFTMLPYRKIIERLTSLSIPVELSNSAGTFVCNHLMYLVGYHLEQTNRKVPFGFVHVPSLETLDQETLTHGVTEIIRSIL